MKILVTVIAFSLLVTTLQAQDSVGAQRFKAVGKLEKPDHDGFYRIFLSPVEAPYLNEFFHTARILDSRKNEIPYSLTADEPTFLPQQFKEYEILEKNQIPDDKTILRIHNPTKAELDNMCLVIKNADVRKYAKITGSDDGKQWFVVRERCALNLVNYSNSVEHVWAISFPLTNYKYYQFEISDTVSAPLNILRAGNFGVSTSTSGKYSAVPDSVIVTTDSKQKRTYIRMKFKQPQIVDKIELTMAGAVFFQRSAWITTEQTRKIKKREEKFDQIFDNFTIRSGVNTVLTFDVLITDNLTICIDNENNPPLSLGSVTAYQLNRYLAAWLKKDETYTIGFTGKDLQPVYYDLDNFRDSIPVNSQILNIVNLNAVEFRAMDDSPTFFTSKVFIWIALGAVIILMAFMSRKLIREAGSKQS